LIGQPTSEHAVFLRAFVGDDSLHRLTEECLIAGNASLYERYE
jgi:hypothetical protein